MIGLERLEKGTPEFQMLTPEQQQQRRDFLRVALDGVIKQNHSTGFTQEELAVSVGNLLEFYLSGKMERIVEMPHNPKKH